MPRALSCGRASVTLAGPRFCHASRFDSSFNHAYSNGQVGQCQRYFLCWWRGMPVAAGDRIDSLPHNICHGRSVAVPASCHNAGSNARSTLGDRRGKGLFIAFGSKEKKHKSLWASNLHRDRVCVRCNAMKLPIHLRQRQKPLCRISRALPGHALRRPGPAVQTVRKSIVADTQRLTSRRGIAGPAVAVLQENENPGRGHCKGSGMILEHLFVTRAARPFVMCLEATGSPTSERCRLDHLAASSNVNLSGVLGSYVRNPTERTHHCSSDKPLLEPHLRLTCAVSNWR